MKKEWKNNGKSKNGNERMNELTIGPTKNNRRITSYTQTAKKETHVVHQRKRSPQLRHRGRPVFLQSHLQRSARALVQEIKLGLLLVELQFFQRVRQRGTGEGLSSVSRLKPCAWNATQHPLLSGRTLYDSMCMIAFSCSLRKSSFGAWERSSRPMFMATRSCQDHLQSLLTSSERDEF